MLTTRRTLSDFSQVIATLKPLEDATLKDRYTLGPLKDRLQNVRTIWLLGPSLVNIWAPNIDLFFEIVRKGGEIRMLVFNPKCAYLPVLAEQIRVRPDRLKMDIVKTMDECTELAKDVHAAGKFEVRRIETIPGYSMVISDPSKPDGHMIVEYYGYRSSLNERPHVELDVARSRRWFDYYLNQYEELWKSAIPYKFDVLPA